MTGIIRLKSARSGGGWGRWPWMAAFAIAGLIAVPSPEICAQDAMSLDMASVANLARNRSWEAKEAHENAAAAHAVAKQTEALRWGRVDFQSQYLRFDNPIVSVSPVPPSLQAAMKYAFGVDLKSFTTPVAPQDNLHVTLQAGLPLFTGGKITNAIREAKSGSKAASEAASDTDNDVVLTAENRYLSTLLARDVVQLHEAALRSYKQHLDQANSAFKQGVAAKYDVIRAEAAVADQEKKLTEAKNQLALAEAALRTALALDDKTSLQVGGNLFEIAETVDVDHEIAAAVQASPILKALHDKIAADKSGVHVQQGDYLPQVTAIAGRELVDNKLAQTDPNWFAGARLTLDLFDGGARHERVSQARAQLRSSQYQYNSAEEQIRLAVRSACLDFESKKSELTSARKAAELSAESLRLATKRFEVGTGTSLEVLDANVVLNASQVQVQNAMYGIDLAYLRIHRYQGDIAEVAARIQK